MIFNKTFGRYRLAKKLATGGMADVFLAVRQGDGGFERLVVLKSCLPHLQEEPAAVAMFRQEGRIGARIENPHVVRLLDVEVSDRQSALVLEYVPGCNLDELSGRLAGERLSPDEAARCIADAARGLAAAHRATDLEGRDLGIVHRDVSPHNLLVDTAGVTRLFDFGVALTASSEEAAGRQAGKTAYMSPEQCQGRPLDARADLFALGVVFYELLTGARLFARDSFMASMRAITEEEVAPPSSLVPGLTAELDAIVLRLLERDPDDRTPTADEAATAIEGWLGARSEAARLALGARVTRLFAAELAEHRAVGAKVLAAPAQAATTVDLATYRYTGAVPVAAEAAPLPTPAAAQPQVVSGTSAADLAAARRNTLVAIVVALLCAVAAVAGFLRPRPVAPTPIAPVVVAPPVPAPAQAAPSAAETGAVRVVFEPTDAALFVDGEAVGKQSPADITGLSLGKEHNLRLEREGFETIFFPFKLDNAEVLEIQLQLTTAVPVGRVDIDSDPPGAEVWIAGHQAGVTPLKGLELAANRNFVVEFRRAGAPTVRRSIFVRSGANPPVVLRPQGRVSKPAAEPAAAPEARKPLPKKKDAAGKYPLLTE